MATDSPPQSAAQRQAAYRAARRAEGLKEVRALWCHPDDEPELRALAERLQRRRERAGRRAAQP